MASSQTLLVNAFILLILLSLVLTTIKAVIRGFMEGVGNWKAILNGASYEDIKEKDRKKIEKKKKEEEEKMKAISYRVFHPLEFINSVIITKIKEKIS